MCIFSQDIRSNELLGDFTQKKYVNAFWPIPCHVHVKVKQLLMNRQTETNFTCNIILNMNNSYI